MIKAVFFDLGDTLIVEEAGDGTHLWESELGETIKKLLLLLLKTVGKKQQHARQAFCN